MNTYTKQYIREVKAMFPSKGKNERKYIKKLAITVDEFCEEESVKNKLMIYEKYGKPIDIVYDYYSALDTEAIVKKNTSCRIHQVGACVADLYRINRYCDLCNHKI